MSNYEQVWKSLENPDYRREYAADVGTGLAFQINLIREKKGWTQHELADAVGSHQATISQWERPDYGNHTLNSLKNLASAFDLGLMVKFVPFSELVHWNANLTPERLAPPSFEEEAQAAPQASQSLAVYTGPPVTVAANDPHLHGSVTGMALITDPDMITTTYNVRAGVLYPAIAAVGLASGTTVTKEREHELAA